MLRKSSTESGMVLWTCRKVHCFPRSLGIVLGIGISVVFVIAVLRGDVSPYLPYISETGAKLPESGIFSLFLDITATLGVMIIILRYLIVEECILTLGSVVPLLNKISLATGIVSMMGMFIISAYPVLSILRVHNTGALILFVGSLLYGFSHTYISYKMCPEYNSILICHTRLMITIASAVGFISVLTLGQIGLKQWGNVSPDHWPGKKSPDNKGFVLLVVSATAEWIMSFLFIAYYLTYMKEFSKISIHLNVRMLVRHFDEETPLEASVDEKSPPL